MTTAPYYVDGDEDCYGYWAAQARASDGKLIYSGPCALEQEASTKLADKLAAYEHHRNSGLTMNNGYVFLAVALICVTALSLCGKEAGAFALGVIVIIGAVIKRVADG